MAVFQEGTQAGKLIKESRRGFTTCCWLTQKNNECTYFLLCLLISLDQYYLSWKARPSASKVFHFVLTNRKVPMTWKILIKLKRYELKTNSGCIISWNIKKIWCGEFLKKVVNFGILLILSKFLRTFTRTWKFYVAPT